MTEEREFEVNKGIVQGRHNKCLVCEEYFKLKEKIVLCPIQKPKTGWDSVMSIPIHVKCFWVEKDD